MLERLGMLHNIKANASPVPASALTLLSVIQIYKTGKGQTNIS